MANWSQEIKILALHGGAGDNVDQSDIFDKTDFGFDDDENVSIDPENSGNSDGHKMPETVKNLRRSAMAPPQG